MLRVHLLYLTFLLLFFNPVLTEEAPIRLINATGVDEEPVEIYELPRTVQVQKYIIDFDPFPLFSGFNYKATIKNWSLSKQHLECLSYLLTVLIGDLRHKRISSKHGVSIRVISIPEAEPYLDGPAQILRNCFDATQSMFDLKYPMKKLDAFVDPAYHGAVEDFGLIKLEEDVLQLPSSLPSIEQFYSTNLICHETAHIWFGNIVTNDKWTDIWLHESFANYISFRNMLLFVNEANYVEAEFVKTKQIGLTAMLNRSLSMPIAQNNQRFSDITYDAGANVLRMLEAIIGVGKFQKILNNFIKRFAYRNANYSDFVSFVQKVNELNSINSTSLCGQLTIREVMDDYLTQTSIPIVSVDITNQGKFKLIQTRQTNKWNVPLFLNDHQIVWLLKNGSVCSSKSLNFDQEELLIFNYKSYSFASFEYSLSYWERLIDADLTKIDELTLLGLIQDLERQIKQKRLHQRNRFKRHKKSKKNKKKSKKLKSMMQILIAQVFRQFDGNVLPQFIEYLKYLDAPTQRSLISLSYPHATWSNASTWREGHFSADILHLAVQFNVRDARTQAKNLFLQFVQDCKSFKQLETCNRIDANARKAVYSVASYIKQTKFLKAYRKALNDSVEPYFYFRQELRNIEDALYE
ncbi:hypothetical protein M3Y97_00008800 [Aphelenchoides bicaudatus]|nr:hypothetical protein M3Y97_00008800 [Aphelenchoides bicaudatus]